jgi:predicted small secreted protein
MKNTFGIVMVLALISGTIASCNSNNGGSTGSSVDTNSFDYRYAKERVKLEGYSDKESAQAAEAIIKFQNAQRNK